MAKTERRTVANLAERFANLDKEPSRSVTRSSVSMVAGADDLNYHDHPDTPRPRATLKSYKTTIGIMLGDIYLVDPNRYSYSTGRHQHALKWALIERGYVNIGPTGYDVASNGMYNRGQSEKFHQYVKADSPLAGTGMPVKNQVHRHGFVDWDITDEDFEPRPMYVRFNPGAVYTDESGSVRFYGAITIVKGDHGPSLHDQDLTKPVDLVYIPFPATIDARRFTNDLNSGEWYDIFLKLWHGMSPSGDRMDPWKLSHHGRTAVKMLTRRWAEEWRDISKGWNPDYEVVKADDLITRVSRDGDDMVIAYTIPDAMSGHNSEVTIVNCKELPPSSIALSFSMYMLEQEQKIVTNAMHAIFAKDVWY